MKDSRSGMLVTGALSAVVFFVVGYAVKSCPKPDDGNPIGSHLHGLVKVKRSGAPQCLKSGKCHLYVDFTTTRASATPPASASCPRLPGECLQFSDQMDIQTVDDTTSHPDETVNATGTVVLSP
jgi:hypothetical protein